MKKKTIKKTLLMMVMAFALVLATMALTACGDDSEQAASDEQTTAATEAVTEDSEAPAEEDGQNPAMNFIGNYACDRASVLIECDGLTGMKATVSWASSSAEEAKWVMSGTFDAETLLFEYHDCVKTENIYNEDGEVESSEEVFTGGHGFMQFKENPLSLTWQEDQEHVADDMVFEYAN